MQSFRSISYLNWKSNAKQEKELDFLARFPTYDAAIEVKASKNFSQKALSQLGEYLKINPKTPSYVVYLGEPKTIKIFGNLVWMIPPYLLGSINIRF